MRLLLDESLPRPLSDLLVGHDVHTVTQMGWTSLGNGALLRQAAVKFDALVTADQNIEFQQNLKMFRSRRCLTCEMSRAPRRHDPWTVRSVGSISMLAGPSVQAFTGVSR